MTGTHTLPSGRPQSLSRLPPPHAFFGISALAFGGGAALTIAWCASMSGMGEMPMPGGWSMSMMWMRMPDQTWLAATASFLGMWAVMMVAMMLPSFAPMLWRYRQAVSSASRARLAGLTTLVTIGYYTVWIALGVVLYPLGLTLAHLAMEHPAVSRTIPFAGSVALLIAGTVQFTAWKARHLACCRAHPPCDQPPSSNPGAAWRHGLRLGLHCKLCCASHTILLLILGAMDLRVMALVTLAITLERLAPSGERIARALGALIFATGIYLLVQAASSSG